MVNVSKSVTKTKDKSISKSVTKTKDKSVTKSVCDKKGNNLVLLEHQLKTIKYLVSRCINQHGLLLYQVMGSGKTNLALFLAKNYPKNDIVLIIPDGLDSVWLESAKSLKLKIKLILTYNNLTPELLYKHRQTIKDSILIIDEAHHLIELIKQITEGTSFSESSDNSEDLEETEGKFDTNTRKLVTKKAKGVKEQSKNALIEILDLFKSSKKVLLLTGTPIKNDLADIRWLINIAAGKQVLPYNIAEFTKKYYSGDKKEAIFVNYLEELIFLNNPLTGQPLIPRQFRVSFKHINYYQDEIYKLIIWLVSSKLTDILSKNFKYNLPSFNMLFGESVSNFIHRFRQLNTASLSTLASNGILDSFKKNIMSFNRDKSNLILERMQKPILNQQELLIFFVLAIFSKGLLILIGSFIKYIKDNTYESLDVQKIAAISPYVSYYTYDNLEYYPSHRIIKESVKYTDYQLDLFIRIIFNFNITDIESVFLGFNKRLSEAELFKPTDTSYSMYLNKCRMIGNLPGYNPIGYNPIGSANEFEFPIKFKKIADMYLKNNLSTIVYSSFENTLNFIGDYFKQRKISYAVFSPLMSVNDRIKLKEDFKNKKVKMLLLHPNYYEGFDIKGCRIFHVLEPLIEYYKREQLYTRPIRFCSHSHLPTNERNVIIYQWKCTLENVFDHIRQEKSKLRDWFNNDIGIIYFARYARFKDKMSPDDIIDYNHLNIDKKIIEFRKTMKKLSIDNSELPLHCNIYGDLNVNKNNKFKLQNCSKALK